MIAKLAYLASPDPGRYIVHIQPFGSDELMSIELAPEQLINILINGTTLMLRTAYHRVPTPSQPTESAQ